MSKLKSRVVKVNNRRTSIRLCSSEWEAFDDICLKEKTPRKKIIEALEVGKRNGIGLTSSLRLFTTSYYHDLAKKLNPSVKSVVNRLFY